MKKASPLIALAALAACLSLSCAANATASNEEASAVMAMAGAQLGQDAGAKAIARKGLGAIASKDMSLTMVIDGPKGGTATFAYSITGLSPMTFSGSIAYADFAIEYEGATYILNGAYSLTMTYEAGPDSFSIAQGSKGSLSIVKNGGSTKDFAVDTTSTSTVSCSESGGIVTIVLDTVVTGTINGEAINRSEHISFSA